MYPDIQGRVLPYTWRTLQNPIAPSPTAHDSPFSKPLAFFSSSISFRDYSPHPVSGVPFLLALIISPLFDGGIQAYSIYPLKTRVFQREISSP